MIITLRNLPRDKVVKSLLSMTAVLNISHFSMISTGLHPASNSTELPLPKSVKACLGNIFASFKFQLWCYWCSVCDRCFNFTPSFQHLYITYIPCLYAVAIRCLPVAIIVCNYKEWTFSTQSNPICCTVSTAYSTIPLL